MYGKTSFILPILFCISFVLNGCSTDPATLIPTEVDAYTEKILFLQLFSFLVVDLKWVAETNITIIFVGLQREGM
jgi:hypothetical protein